MRDDETKVDEDYEAFLFEELNAAARVLSTRKELQRRKLEIEEELAKLSSKPKRVALPMLRRIRVAAPCDEGWALMKGNDRVRKCTSCEEKVFNLSEMSKGEAEQLLNEHGTSICVRFYRRRDGTVMTKECAPGIRMRRRHRVAASLVGVGVAAAILSPRLAPIEGRLFPEDTSRFVSETPYQEPKPSTLPEPCRRFYQGVPSIAPVDE